jgi:hypothetical protein
MMMSMIRPRTVILIGAVSLALGWMVGNTSSPATQEPTAQRRTSGPRPLGASATTVAPYTAQLRRKLEEQPRSPLPGRNPFVFGSRRAYSPPPISRDGRTEAERESLPAPAPPPLPAFRLSGIAASEKDGAVMLTAIVIDNGSMVFAKAGDKLSGGHSVLRVEEKAVVIVDAAGVEQVLRLP